MYLYVHIPFCASKCIYCDFTVQLNKYGGHQGYIHALHQELRYRVAEFECEGETIEGIYMGGGTPSLLSADTYRQLFKTIHALCPIADNAEITLEANPNAVVDLPSAYLEAGFNRVSIGIQSLNNTELKTLSRNHSAEEAMACMNGFIAGGFTNVSIDLMYGFPTQTLGSWKTTLSNAAALPIQHISLYGLQVEDGTPMAQLVNTSAYSLPTDDTYGEMKTMACTLLQQQGYQHYEISNFCKAGFESKNNLNTWQQGNFLAIGAGAHGYMHPLRYANSGMVNNWITAPTSSYTSEQVSQSQQIENHFIFGLRTNQGVNIPKLEKHYQIQLQPVIEPIVHAHSPALRISHNGTLTMAPDYWPVSNSILADFIDLPIPATL